MKLKELICINENINLDEYLEFKEYVKKYMEHPEWLGSFTKEDLEFMLKNGSKIWVYYLNKEPVCSMIFIPANKEALENLELNLEPKEVANYGTMIVNPNYVGNRLQYQMLKELDNYSKNNNYKYATATIHPDNIFSINNILKAKFNLVGQKEFKRGLRNIYLKTLDKE